MLAIDAERRQRLFDWFGRATEVPMLVLAVVFLFVIAAPIVFRVPRQMRSPLELVGWAIWAAFAAELGIKTYLAPQRWRYLYTHWYDVAVVAIPFLRPLRVVRSLRLLRGLELLRLGSVGLGTASKARSILSRHGLQYALLVAGLVVLGAAAAEAMIERAAGGNIREFGTGLWWAIETVTTVGYGDTYPITPEGRGIAVLLMVVGVTLFSFVTANVAAFLVELQNDEERVTLDQVMAKLEVIEDQLSKLSADVEPSPSPAPEDVLQAS